MNDDDRWIDQTLSGDSAAFGHLVRKYQDRLFNTLYYVVGHAEDARDIVQEAFVQAFLKLGTFHRASAFYTWLYRVALNVAATHRRKRRPSVSIDQSARALAIEPIDRGDAPGRRIDQEETCRQVHQALDALSEEHRAILVLREIEGCCYETIAEILDLPIGTVRSRLHRARLQLRDQLRQVLAVDR